MTLNFLLIDLFVVDLTDSPVTPEITLLHPTSPNSFIIGWAFLGSIYDVGRYTIEVQFASKPNSEWIQLNQYAKAGEVELSDPRLTAFTQFNVRVVLSSLDGTARQSAVMQVRTTIGIPKDAPNNFEVYAPDSESLQLSWMVRLVS